MAARRQVQIFLNGQQVEASLKNIYSAKRQVTNELNKMVVGTEAYEKKVRELQGLNTIIGDHQRKLSATGAVYGKLQTGLQGFVGIAAGAFAVDRIIGYGQQLFKLGAEMDLLAAKAQTVLGDALSSVTREAERHAEAMGLTTRQYIDQTAAVADLLVPMEFTREEAANLATNVVNLAGAFAEWSAGQYTAEEAAESVRKALLGEREELERYGISIKQAEVNAELAARGLNKLTGNLQKQAEAMVTLDLITRKSADAQAAYLVNTNTSIRRQAEMRAQLQSIQETIAQALVPAFSRLVSVAAPFVDLLEDFITIPVDKKLRDEQVELNVLVARITDANTSQAERNALITELQRTYPDFLGNLDAETVTNEQLAERLKEVNNQYIFKIALAKEDEKIQRAAEKLANQQRKLAGKDLEIQEKLVRLNDEYKFGVDLTNLSLAQRVDAVQAALAIRRDEQESEAGFLRIAKEITALEASGRDVIEKRVVARRQEVEELQNARAELRKILEQQLGLDADAIDGQPVDSELQKRIAARRKELELLSAAEEEQRKTDGDKAAKDRQREAEREAKDLANRLERLKEIVADYQTEARLARLADDERRLEELRLKYQKEIDLALELERKGIKAATEQRIELERLRDEALRELELELAQQRLEDRLALEDEMYQALLDRQRQYEEERREADDEIHEFIKEARSADLDATLEELDTYYHQIIAKAKQNGIDTLDIEIVYANARKQIQDKKAKDEISLARETQEVIQGIYFDTFSTIADALGQFVDESSALYGLFVVFQKGVAIAEVILNLQKELAGIAAANAPLGPLGIALTAAQSTAANVAAGVRIATIAATAIPQLAKAKKSKGQRVKQGYTGGWFDVTGEDDGRDYRAQYIGRQRTGLLPAHPVLLASEHGPEFLVSHADLRRPAVLDHVRAIENITSTSRPVPQYAAGGFTTPAPAPPATMQLPAELVSVLIRMNTLLEDLAANGVSAVVDDDLVVGIRRKEKNLVRAAGGVL